MKLHAFAALFSLAALAEAHDARSPLAARRAHHAKRQANLAGAASSPAPSAPAPSAPAPSGPAPSAIAVTASTTSAATSAAAAATAPPSAPQTGAESVPPLIDITSGMPSGTSLALAATYTAGAKPPIAGAPPLPTPFVFNVNDWPAQDKLPDITSDEVQGWMKELDGFDIPDWSPTVDGTCADDPNSVAQAADRGWWTCGGYTRSTDITACPKKYDWGLSFDDGPSPYTQKLLNYLDAQDIQATFFVVGSRVVERPDVLREEYMSGHEISVHTWSHKYLTTLTNEEIVAELGWTRKAIQTVLGVTPTTMRPPYGDIDDRVRAISLAMGLVPIIWTSAPQSGPFDTNDWRVAGGLVDPQTSFNIFEGILGNASTLNTGFIVLEHDLFEITVDLAVGYTLNAALTHQPPFSLKPIGQCTGIPPPNLYLESNTNTSFPYTNHTTSSGKQGGSSAGNTTTTGGSEVTKNSASANLGLSGLAAVAAVGAAVLHAMLF